jgi:hypothetical protein
VMLSCDVYSKQWYYTVSRSDFKMVLRINIIYNLKLLSREYIWFKVVVWFVVLKSICGGSSHRVARHTGTHIIYLFACFDSMKFIGGWALQLGTYAWHSK